MNHLTELLISSSINGNFIETILQSRYQSDYNETELNSIIITLHNENKIDVVSKFNNLNIQRVDFELYFVLDLFCKILPQLNTTVVSVISCIKSLVDKYGKNPATNLLYDAFCNFCKVGTGRVNEALELGQQNELVDFICPALIAGSYLNQLEYLDKTIILSKNSNRQVQIKAIFALGMLYYGGRKLSLKKSSDTLINLLHSDFDSFLFSAILHSALLLVANENTVENDVLETIKHILTYDDNEINYVATSILAKKMGQLPQNTSYMLIKLLSEKKSLNEPIIRQVDAFLYELLKKEEFNEVTEFIEKVLLNNSDKISITQFELTISHLSNKNLSDLITQWFLSKKSVLCRAMSDILYALNKKNIDLHIELPQNTDISNFIFIFLTKKAIGWLYDFPLITCRYIISLLTHPLNSSDNEKEEIVALLFNPLLISYPFSVKNLLKNEKKNLDKKTKLLINKSLKKLDEYFKNISTTCEIKELNPYLSHREAYSRHTQKVMNEEWKKAQQESTLMSMCNTLQILYGRGAINYVTGRNEAKERIEIPLNSLSYTTELPALRYLDPHGLYILRYNFRHEGCE